MSFTPRTVHNEIKKHFPDFEVDYEIDPVRQAIADSWPRKFDDRNARFDISSINSQKLIIKSGKSGAGKKNTILRK